MTLDEVFKQNTITSPQQGFYLSFHDTSISILKSLHIQPIKGDNRLLLFAISKLHDREGYKGN